MALRDDFYAVILAGGSGTRFWPLSREKKPKQFLNIIGSGTLLQNVIRRILPRVRSNHIFVVANEAHQREIKKQIRSFRIPPGNILLEPEGKNTAPAICWAASLIQFLNRHAVMIILPSDHLILNAKAFLKSVDKAADLAQRDYLVTLGIAPTRPETGYGYLKIIPVRIHGKDVFRVRKFIEKPSPKKARQFVKSKGYLWNSGMFVLRTSVILDKFKRHLPRVYGLLGKKNNRTVPKKSWHRLPSISIDCGILEKADNIVAVSAQKIEWSDLGSWESLMDILSKDKDGNIHRGDVMDIDSQGTLVLGKDRLIATVGLKDIIVVDTKDALLVCRKDMSQNIKDLVIGLKKAKRKEYRIAED